MVRVLVGSKRRTSSKKMQKRVGPGGRQCEQHFFPVEGGGGGKEYPVVRRYEYPHSFSQAADLRDMG